MFEAQGFVTTVLAAFLFMPLLMEFVSTRDRSCYRHGAPNGTLPRSQHPILPKTAKNPPS
jgi:hypothetical protein